MSPLIAAAASILVFCAPGYPGSSTDAQPLVGEFATSLAAAAGWPAGSLSAVYDANEQSDLQRLAAPDVFFVQHGKALHLVPLAQAEVQPAGAQQRWTLVMKAGHGPLPAALAGMTLFSTAGYAPDFVQALLRPIGPLPADVTITATGQVLSALRRAANGEPVAVLLDQEQAGALATLPFASGLQAVATSAPVPVALVVNVGGRLPQDRADGVQGALLHLAGTPAGSATLGRLKLNGFVPPRLPATPGS
jgi:hypothetical protein